MHRGEQKGCPVSAQSFILVVELLALDIKKTQKILKDFNFQVGWNLKFLDMLTTPLYILVI